MLEKAYAGTLSLTDLFSQHNEHHRRNTIAPRVFMLLLAVIFNYNTLVEMYFGGYFWFYPAL